MIKKHFRLVIYLSLYFLIIAFKLIINPTPFFDWDESINAQVSREMIENKSLVPLWQGSVWLDKPPLPFLFFGVIMKLTPFISPEISLRITSLLLSIISLLFVYSIFYKATKDKLISLLTVIITSFIPIFLQRSQILNLDVFLLIGWLGYLLFVQNFWLGLLFLAVSVLTKSLIGFYPVIILIIYHVVLLWKNKMSQGSNISKLSRKYIRTAAIQIIILLVWYIIMLLSFKTQFWQQHIIETHFRRVTASIEYHFGQRTYYIDLMKEQLGLFFWPSAVGLLLAVVNLSKSLTKYSDRNKWLNTFFLLPWFMFLNITKTKIFWYLYPAIPQFAFLAVYPLTLFLSHSGKSRAESRDATRIVVNKIFLYLISCIMLIYIFHRNFIKTNFFTTFYSKPEDYYHLALYAKDKCDSLHVLVGKETREANKTLEDLGLTITSTTQWGDHPSIVYYFGKKVNFIYDDKFKLKYSDDCLVLRRDDLNTSHKNKNLRLIKSLNSYHLFKKN